MRYGAAISVLAIVAGCAGFGALTKETPAEVKEAAVQERSSARWASLIKGDKDTAYGYLSPASRELISLDQYRGRVNTGHFRAARIDKVDCEPESCKVDVYLTYDFAPTPAAAAKGAGATKGVTTYLQETWVLDKGQVWYVWR